MIKFISPEFEIVNISNKTLTLLDNIRLKRGDRVDVFKYSPSISESAVVDALRAPHGEFYIEAFVRKTIKIEKCVLMTFEALPISEKNLDLINTGKPGQVLSLNENGKFEWVFRGDVGRLDAHPPLIKNGETLAIPPADAFTNGYLSKEDWLLFKGKSKGIRIWQYQDFSSVDEALKLSRFENGIGNVFDKNYIINSSAVIVQKANLETAPKIDQGLLKNTFGASDVYVTQHEADVVMLNRSPKSNLECRVYFLVILPENVDLPKNYEQPPRFVRNARIELADAIDIDTGGSKSVKGEKTFDDPIYAKSGLSVVAGMSVEGGFSTDAIQVTKGAAHNYVLAGNGVGNAEWSTVPYVGSLPPHNFYDGQLWVKAPEYEVFVHDGSRKKWRGVETFDFSGSTNTTSANKIYLNALDNIPSNICGLVLDYDAVLVGLVASSEVKSSWVAEVHVNHSLVKDAVLPIVNNDRGYSSTLNVDFRAGDKIQLFANGESISMPYIKAIFRKRV